MDTDMDMPEVGTVEEVTVGSGADALAAQAALGLGNSGRSPSKPGIRTGGRKKQPSNNFPDYLGNTDRFDMHSYRNLESPELRPPSTTDERSLRRPYIPRLPARMLQAHV